MASSHGKHSWSFPVMFIVIFYLNIHICSSSDKEWWPPPRCNTSNIPEVSKYVSNLNAALNILRVDADKGSFNSSEYGQSPDQVYALLQCRGDATVDDCYNCSKQVKIDVLQSCGSQIGSRVQKEFCFLRFENYNFIGELNTFVVNLTNKYTVSSDPAVFLAAARQLLSNLSSDILSGSATNRFSSHSTIDSSRHPITALAQCWGDISLADCKTCLSIAIDSLFTNNSGRLGARALAGSCIVQYQSNFTLPPPTPRVSSNPAYPPQPQRLEKSSTIAILVTIWGPFHKSEKVNSRPAGPRYDSWLVQSVTSQCLKWKHWSLQQKTFSSLCPSLATVNLMLSTHFIMLADPRGAVNSTPNPPEILVLHTYICNYIFWSSIVDSFSSSI